MKSWLASQKQFIVAAVVFSLFGTGAAFALPYTPSDAQLNPTCAPGSANCYVSIDSLPDQASHTNQLLFTDGADAAWASGLTWNETTDAFTVATGASKTLLLDPANNIYKFGDIDAKNNNIHLSLDDANTEINLYTKLLGTTYSVFRLNPAVDNSLDNQIFIGLGAGRGASDAYHSNFIGYRAGESGSSASFSNFFGYRAGENSPNATNSNFFGQRAGNTAPDASYSNFFGFNAGNSSVGSNNIIIGTNISLPNGTANSINIGGVLFGTGTYSTTTGSPSTLPVSGGKIGIGTSTPGEVLEVVGNIISRGTSWTTRTSSSDNSWGDVEYGDGLFVAVGGDGTGSDVMTSPDGINWTTRTTPNTNSWTGVAYGNGLFVAVGSSGTGNRVMTSPDGITWTARTSAANYSWTDVAYGNGVFVAVANSSDSAMYSYDGITWTEASGDINTDRDWRSVTYANGLFVTVGSKPNTDNIATSPDGINWTLRSKGTTNQLIDVAYGNGLFVAVSYANGSGTRVFTSPDGITWTTRSTPVDNQWISVVYGDGLFVAVSFDGTGNRIMTSPDGINWTIRSNPVDNAWRALTYANGIFVATSTSGTGNRVMTSGKTVQSPIPLKNIFQDGFKVNGSLGIGLGVSSPAYRLDVLENTASTYATRIFHDGNNTNRFGLLIQAGLDDHTAAGPSTLISFADGDGTTVGSITFGSSATAYNTTSDQRLKDIVNDTTTLSLNTLNQIKIHDFSWKADPEKKVYAGVFAQELYDVFPMAVTKPQDESTGTWMVDYSKLTPLIIQSIQEIDANFKSLDATKENTLAYLVKQFLESAGNQLERLFAREATVETLCVGTADDRTCINKNQLDALLQSQGIPQTVVSTPDPALEPAPQPILDPTPEPQDSGEDTAPEVVTESTPETEPPTEENISPVEESTSVETAEAE